MSIDDKDLLDFAESLVKAGASEIELRAAISRSYYAAFHALAPFADELPKSKVCPPNLNRLSHTELKERLREWRVEDVSANLVGLTATKGRLWRSVDAACNDRVIADYRLGNNVSLAQAQSQIYRVKEILRNMKQIEAEIQRGQEVGNSTAGGGNA